VTPISNKSLGHGGKVSLHPRGELELRIGSEGDIDDVNGIATLAESSAGPTLFGGTSSLSTPTLSHASMSNHDNHIDHHVVAVSADTSSPGMVMSQEACFRNALRDAHRHVGTHHLEAVAPATEHQACPDDEEIEIVFDSATCSGHQDYHPCDDEVEIVFYACDDNDPTAHGMHDCVNNHGIPLQEITYPFEETIIFDYSSVDTHMPSEANFLAISGSDDPVAHPGRPPPLLSHPDFRLTLPKTEDTIWQRANR
jgi:hypothetical protein